MTTSGPRRVREPRSPLKLQQDVIAGRLGVAEVRALQILRLLDLYKNGEITVDGAVQAIGAAALAILDGDEP